MLDFNNKKILIVGASSGIGKKAATVLANQGAKVILVARREEKLKQVCSSIEPGKAFYYINDISHINTIEKLVTSIVTDHGKLDGMAYVAGISDDDVPLKYLSYDRQLSTFTTNYFAFVECVRQVSNRKNYNNGLRIVAVSSVASIRGDKAHIAYSASKAAMDSAIRCIAKELGSKGICINSVAPSMVNTEMYQRFMETKGETEFSSLNTLNRQYLGLAETDDIANTIAFLLSTEARFITGITLPVDGGFSTT